MKRKEDQMPMLSEPRTTDEMLAEVLEHEARETARLLFEYDPCEEIEEFPSDPETWPAWVDANCWTPTDPAPYEPSEDDRAWLAPQDLAEDAEDLQASAAWVERLEASHAVTDADLIAAGLAVG